MQFIYDNIIYAELNTKSDYCQICGWTGEIEIVKDEETNKLIWRCPNCGKTGSSSTFINGCPDCGYAVGDSKNNYNFNNINKSKNSKRNSKSFSIFQNRKNGSSHQYYQNKNDGLPFWIYLIVTSILIVLIICFYRCVI